MPRKRILVGGPSNSGKSTLVLSLVEFYRRKGLTAEAIELDLWSNSYPAFLGQIPFEGRSKKFDLRWNWQEPLVERLKQFTSSPCDIVFGDMPGKLGEACAYMCKHAAPDGAIVVSRTIEGLTDWLGFFDDFDIPVVAECITFKKRRPVVLTGLDRIIDPAHADVVTLGDILLSEK